MGIGGEWVEEVIEDDGAVEVAVGADRGDGQEGQADGQGGLYDI